MPCFPHSCALLKAVRAQLLAEPWECNPNLAELVWMRSPHHGLGRQRHFCSGVPRGQEYCPRGLAGLALSRRGLAASLQSSRGSPLWVLSLLGTVTPFLPCKITVSILCLHHQCTPELHSLPGFTGSQLRRKFAQEESHHESQPCLLWMIF